MSGFSNPVANAAGTLIRAVMKSVNYVAGLAGWQISKNGDAEFNEGSFRGVIRITAPNGAVIEIDSNAGTGFHPQITFYSPDHTAYSYINAPNYGDPSRVELGLNGAEYTAPDGVLRRGRLYFNDDDTTLAVIKLNERVRGGYVTAAAGALWLGFKDQDANLEGGFITLQRNVAYMGWRDLLSSPDSQNILFSGAPQISVTHPMNLTNETWHFVTLQNGWTNEGGNRASLQYRKVVAPCFSIQIVGNIVAGTATDSTIIGNLPAGYRPAKEVLWSVAAGPLPAAGALGPLMLLTQGGNLVIFGASAGGRLYINTTIPLDATL